MNHKINLKEYICFFLAFIISFIIVNTSFNVPDYSVAQQCETTLKQYIANHSSYLPPENIEISITDNSITASLNFFVYSKATLNNDGFYTITTNIRILSLVFCYVIVLVLLSCALYAFFNGFLYFSYFIFKKVSIHLKTFFEFIQKKVHNLRDYLKQKKIQKELKEYEDPRLQEIYQLGYNVGYADGISEGMMQSKNYLPEC